jgi:cbb3-type cytochrome oxidase maturation protein
MHVLFILAAISLTLALVFLGAFVWSVKDGQYEDDQSPGMRILFEDQPAGYCDPLPPDKKNAV